MTTTVIRARVNSTHAKKAREILGGLGLRPSDAISVLMAQIVAHRGLPFSVQEEGYAYAASEYGLSRNEMDAAAVRIQRDIARERRRGTIRHIRGPDDLR